VETESGPPGRIANGRAGAIGIGLRKALEFLVKDYAILRQPTKEAEIRKAVLYLLEQLPNADSAEDLEALLPWNVKPILKARSKPAASAPIRPGRRPPPQPIGWNRVVGENADEFEPVAHGIGIAATTAQTTDG
jgi:hypothetical protein